MFFFIQLTKGKGQTIQISGVHLPVMFKYPSNYDHVHSKMHVIVLWFEITCIEQCPFQSCIIYVIKKPVQTDRFPKQRRWGDKMAQMPIPFICEIQF